MGGEVSEEGFWPSQAGLEPAQRLRVIQALLPSLTLSFSSEIHTCASNFILGIYTVILICISKEHRPESTIGISSYAHPSPLLARLPDLLPLPFTSLFLPQS